MTQQEIQRMMESIVRREKSFSEGMKWLTESHAKSERRLSGLEDALVSLHDKVRELACAAREIGGT